MIIVFETELNQQMHNFMFHLNSIFNLASLQRKLSTSQAKMEYFGASNPPRWGKEQQFEKKQVNLGKVR